MQVVPACQLDNPSSSLLEKQATSKGGSGIVVRVDGTPPDSATLPSGRAIIASGGQICGFNKEQHIPHAESHMSKHRSPFSSPVPPTSQSCDMLRPSSAGPTGTQEVTPTEAHEGNPSTAFSTAGNECYADLMIQEAKHEEMPTKAESGCTTATLFKQRSFFMSSNPLCKMFEDGG